MQHTLLPDSLRKHHADNPDLGCGNFLHEAVRVSPYADQQHFWMDKPVTLFTGEIFQGFSLKQLQHAVDTYASWYYGEGVRPKDVIAVYVGEGIENLIHYLALNAIGAIPAVINGNMPARIASLWLEKVRASGLYSDEPHLEQISPHLKTMGTLRFAVSDTTAAQKYSPKLPKHYPYRHAEKDPVLIGHSSGTTGIPKAVEFQHQQFFYGIRYRLGLPFAQGSERVLSALPHSHSAGIAYIMLAALSGCSTLILSTNKPEVVLPNIHSFQPTMIVAFPETYVLLSDSALEKYDLKNVRLWFNGGDAAHEAHIRRLLSVAPHSIFIDGLGSSEMGFSLFRNIHTPTTQNYNRCIGMPLDFVDAAILSEEGEKLNAFEVGRLGIKSPTITPGYWNDSQLTAKSTLRGYFLTGDLCYRDDQGRFFHVDRVPDAITTEHGTVYSLQTEEFLLKHFNEVSDLTVVSTQRRGKTEAIALVRLKETCTGLPSLLERFNEALAGAGKPLLSDIRVGDLSAFPLGPTGKVLKRELRDMFREEAMHA